MSPDIPTWQSIDPAEEELPEELGNALASADSMAGCVVFLVSSGIDRRWGADVSLRVARGWAARGRSVLLADASFDDPVLHESIEGASDEGLSDVMLYGASVKRVARPVEGGILLAPAGTPVGDAAEVLAHPKWDSVIHGFHEAGAGLLVHLSAATTGVDTLLERAAGIIFVAEASADVASIVGVASDRVLAVIGPETTEESEPQEAVPQVVEPEVDMTPEPEPEVVADMDDEQEPEFEVESIRDAESQSEPEAEVEAQAEAELDIEAADETESAPAGVTEEPDDGGLFSMGELPESTGNAADEVDDSGAFSLDGMSGTQYDDPESESEPPDPSIDVPDAVEPVMAQPTDDSATLEVESVEEGDPGLGATDLEMEPVEVESLEAEEPAEEVPQVEAAPVGEALVEEVGMPAVEGVTRSAVEMDEAGVAAAADESHLDMDGFETGAGFDLEDAPDDGAVDLAADEVALGGESEEELETSGEFGFGDGGLEVEASPFPEEDASDDEEEEAALSGVAGDEAFGGRDAGPQESDAPALGDDTASSDVGAGGGESHAVDAAVEAMGVGTDTPPSEDIPPEVDLALDDRPPVKMSGLEELERRRKRGARVRQLVVGTATAVIVGGGGVGVAYFGLVNIPGITPTDRVRSAVPPPVELPGPTPVTPVITHVLAVDAWRNIEIALSTVEALRERLPAFLFFVTVVEVNGADQFGLLAGPAFSAVEADALKEPLAEVLDRLDPTTWVVQEAQYSFFFGEYTEAADAAGRIQSLAALSIPAHVLHVDYPDGTMGLRVYGGAFVDEFQAAAMGRLLRSNDLGDVRLTQRRGRLPE